MNIQKSNTSSKNLDKAGKFIIIAKASKSMMFLFILLDTVYFTLLDFPKTLITQRRIQKLVKHLKLSFL